MADRTIINNRPDTIYHDTNNKTVYIIEIIHKVIPLTINITNKRAENYADQAHEIKKMWHA